MLFDGVKAVTVTTETKLAQESPGLRRGAIGLREMPAAGSLATYAARGLHPAAGFLTAWGYPRRVTEVGLVHLDEPPTSQPT